MATAFGTTIYICRNVPIDKDYNHTLYFADATTQLATFRSFTKYTLYDYSYQRDEKNVIKVNILNDELYDCNYMVFQNSNYSNKWFYCFIDSTEYVSDNVAKINYTVDYMQTWYFDYETGMCMVEREHTITDNIGDNIISEEFSPKDYVRFSRTDINFPYFLGTIILKTPPKTVNSSFLEINDGYSPSYPYYQPNKLNQFSSQTAPNIFCQGVIVYTGFILNGYDYNNYFVSHLSDYALQRLKTEDGDGNTDPSVNIMTLNRFVDAIIKGKVKTAQILPLEETYTFSEDDIVGIYIFPAELRNSSYLANAHNYPNGTAISDVIVPSFPSYFKNKSGSTYTPKNNKMFTYPYIKLITENKSGNSKEYKFENFSPNNQQPNFYWRGSILYKGQVSLYPFNYDGRIQDYYNGVFMNDFVDAIYSGNEYARYMQKNAETIRLNIALNALSSGLQAISTYGMISAVAPEIALPMALTSMGSSIATSKANIIKDKIQLQNTPPKTYSNTNAQDIISSYKSNGFIIDSETIYGEEAQTIDNYFSMYGYKIMQVKELNIRTRGFLNRPHWNYIKTSNCIIHGASGKGLPQDAENVISSIYNNGITFWMNASEVGNYSLDNSPVSQ